MSAGTLSWASVQQQDDSQQCRLWRGLLWELGQERGHEMETQLLPQVVSVQQVLLRLVQEVSEHRGELGKLV